MTEALFDVELNWSAPVWTVREAPNSGRTWAETWHYARRVPSASVFYGTFCPDLIAVVAVGTPAGNATGVGPRLGLDGWPGNLEITRVICHPEAPKNTASRSIARVLAYVHRARGVDWVFSYSDTGQNHHGGIYQALNAIYVGINGGAVGGYTINGVPTHPKTIVNIYGTRAWPKVQQIAAKRGHCLEQVPDALAPKHCYVLPCSTPAVNRAIRRALANKTLPYPKRVNPAMITTGAA